MISYHNYGSQNVNKFEGTDCFMMGVVLWSDPQDQKAVFWCEDHGDLAYYDASADDASEPRVLSPGDMVRFEVSIDRKVRRAHNAEMIESEVCNGLHEHLRHTANQNELARSQPRHSNVVQLIPRQA
jgi:hypothetical protein